MEEIDLPGVKPVEWIADSKRILWSFPKPVRDTVGHALYAAQLGKKHENAKPMKGFKGAGVVEIFESHDTDAYRAVYTVIFKGVVYTLHAFQKKSKKGTTTQNAILS